LPIAFREAPFSEATKLRIHFRCGKTIARALLFPIAWPEPFGLLMIEAMACGTPVIAFRCGSVPEVLTPGQSGMIVDTVDEAMSACQGRSDGPE
jgi:hypothetical protein